MGLDENTSTGDEPSEGVLDQVPAEWEKHVGDEAIKAIPPAGFALLGHSTGKVDWLLDGKACRVSKQGMGDLGITAIPVPEEGQAFLDHLKMRVDPTIDHYHRGEQVVIFAVPREYGASRGVHPDAAVVDPRGSMLINNVKLIQPGLDGHYELPNRFILGFYDGPTNTFYSNPKWESDPAPTDFGVRAERRLLAPDPVHDVGEQAGVGLNAVVASLESSDDDGIW